MPLDFDISNDISVFDGSLPLTLTHLGQAIMSNTVDGSLVPTFQSVDVITDFIGLIRQQDTRNGGAVKQVYERGKSMSNEHVGFTDTYIEAAISAIPVIAVDDIITDPACGDQWIVVGFDKTTLRTRWKIACRKIV